MDGRTDRRHIAGRMCEGGWAASLGTARPRRDLVRLAPETRRRRMEKEGGGGGCTVGRRAEGAGTVASRAAGCAWPGGRELGKGSCPHQRWPPSHVLTVRGGERGRQRVELPRSNGGHSLLDLRGLTFCGI